MAVIWSETDPPWEQLLPGVGHLVGGEVERWWWEAIVSMVVLVLAVSWSLSPSLLTPRVGVLAVTWQGYRCWGLLTWWVSPCRSLPAPLASLPAHMRRQIAGCCMFCVGATRYWWCMS